MQLDEDINKCKKKKKYIIIKRRRRKYVSFFVEGAPNKNTDKGYIWASHVGFIWYLKPDSRKIRDSEDENRLFTERTEKLSWRKKFYKNNVEMKNR